MSSKLPDPRYAKARFVKDLQARRDAQLAAERQAAPQATDADREARLSDAFRAAFQPKAAAVRPRVEHPRESVWDSALRLGQDDDAPRPPQVDPEPVAPEVPPEETRARQQSITAEDLFASLEQRLQATPEAVELPPEVRLRRAFRELPGAQREALAAKVEAEDYGMRSYFSARGLSADYVSVLVGHSLAKRYADAVRLQPDLSPDALLQAMLNQAT